ncbi:MAG: 16S rRNA (guanine(527)-N(7))-methyltransferase RsmG [Mycobacteriaceae bacterium]|nr:16S rRNA (guanine(527)-N(7))-methyltransferase RsmG [Mycobacteriaceae bacterium]
MKHVEVPQAPSAALRLFGDNRDRAGRYAQLLATDGVERGVIGPGEVHRLWDRHLLNSAAIEELIPACAGVVDAGSGAGLPGIPLALARPDLHVILVEPMQRRVDFLREVAEELGIGTTVEVVRGRVEENAVRHRIGLVDVVTCRAVASLDKLAGWCLPLLRPGGQLLAIKGERAEEEVQRHRRVMASHGARTVRVVRCGGDYLDPSTTVVVAERAGTGPRREVRPPKRSGRRA